METINLELFGRDQKIQKSINMAKNISVSKATVLVVGESGTGKKTLAKFIHQQSARATKKILFCDCSQDPKTVENLILGYREENGKFVRGVLEDANGGTVVFSNVDALDEDFQRRLHKILSELEDYDIDVRLIATTTKNLSKLVGSGRFYRGLYTLISSNQITLSPLRDRVEDIEILIQKFLVRKSEELGENLTINRDTLTKMMSHYWTHNIKELFSVLENTVNNMEGSEINDEVLSIGDKKTSETFEDEENEGIRLMSLKEAEKLLIKKALIHTSENRTQAAKILGVSIRTLRNKINEYRNSGSSYFINLR
ncbi:MAG: sigma-54-dependent Fis family transcriptional regulator [Halobacteriovoraceae bacterium]|nr:sigma-54-dependent Fis family transcriptional regulator [Halobacteriovoraceae bacterium]